MSQNPVSGRGAIAELQRLLLPSALPKIGGTEAAARHRSHNDEFFVGGDWYDLIGRPDGQLVAIVGDVVGHGPRQISVMGQMRAASNVLARSLPQPSEILNILDRFARDVPGAEMSSAACLMLDRAGGGRIAYAGHPPLLHIDGAGNFKTIEEGRGPLLSLSDERSYHEFSYEADDIFLLYTDGLVARRDESFDIQLKQIGEFVAERRTASCAAIAQDLMNEFGLNDNDDNDDDVVVLVMRPPHE